MADKPKVTKKFSGGAKKTKKGKAPKAKKIKTVGAKAKAERVAKVSQAEIDAGFPAKGKNVAIRWFTMDEKREYDRLKEAIAKDLEAAGEKPTLHNIILAALEHAKKAA